MTKFGLTLVCAVGFVVALALPDSAAAQPPLRDAYEGTFNGWYLQSNDSNDDGEFSGHTTSAGRTNLGRFESGGVSDREPWDGVTLCFMPNRGVPVGIRLVLIEDSSVTRYDDGLVFNRFVPGSGVTCFDFNDGSSASDFEVDIVGGTGRYEGATGHFTVSVEAYVVSPSVSGYEGRLSGVLSLP